MLSCLDMQWLFLYFSVCLMGRVWNLSSQIYFYILTFLWSRILQCQNTFYLVLSMKIIHRFLFHLCILDMWMFYLYVIIFPITGVTNVCEPTCCFWEYKQGLLEEEPEFLTIGHLSNLNPYWFLFSYL